MEYDAYIELQAAILDSANENNGVVWTPHYYTDEMEVCERLCEQGIFRRVWAEEESFLAKYETI